MLVFCPERKRGLAHELPALALQVSRRFVPLVCGPTLAIMDQHAAAERVRLEELQQEAGCSHHLCCALRSCGIAVPLPHASLTPVDLLGCQTKSQCA